MHLQETPRLRFRQINQQDAEFIFSLYSSPAFRQFVADKGFTSAEDARQFIRDTLMAMYRQHSLGLHLVERKDDRQAIGICGLIRRQGLKDVDLGFGYLPEFESKGYGEEAARAALAVAAADLQLPRVVAITLSNNNRSIKLLRKLGFHYERVHEVLDKGVTVDLWSVSLNQQP